MIKKKKTMRILYIWLLALNLSGCAAIVVGAAAGLGTAAWFSGKLSQDVDMPLARTITVTKSALKSLEIAIEKETITPEKVQLIAVYIDGTTTWIDITAVSQKRSHIEVRVGVTGDKEASRKILNTIIKRM